LLTVIDCNLDSVLRVVPTSRIDDPVVVLHPGLNRLFIVPTDGDTAALVYDCAADSLIASIPLGGEAVFAAHQPRFDKLYVGVYANPNLTVIDAAQCSVIRRMGVGSRSRSPRAFAHPVNGLLYFQHQAYDSVWLIDCSNDSIVGTVVNQVSVDTMFWNAALDRLYLSNPLTTVVLDCGSNVVVDTIFAGAYYAGLMNDSTAKLYLGRNVVSCLSDSFVAGLLEIGTPYNFAWSPADNRVFVSCRQSYVGVYQDAPGGVEERGGPALLRLGLASNPVRGQALFRCQVPPGQAAELSVVDVLGRVVLSRRVQSPFGDSPSPSSLPLDLRSMRAGVYFARLEAGSQKSIAKFVLQR
jgi:DNA-binding beta-propeller fold protein YncE